MGFCFVHALTRPWCVRCAVQEPGGGSGGGRSWEGAVAWGGRQWDEWSAAARSAAGEARERLSWRAVEEWQERHYQAFKERQRARLEAATEEQRQRWRAWEEAQKRRLEELAGEGGSLVRREVAAFEQWQQRWWAAHHRGADTPEARAAAKPTCPQCQLSYLFLPLLPHIGESVREFGLRTKESPEAACCYFLGWGGRTWVATAAG